MPPPPRARRLSAWASKQSQPLRRRADLERAAAEIGKLYEGRDVPRPAFWGGFALSPRSVELWMSHPSRMHHRVRFRVASSAAAAAATESGESDDAIETWERELLCP